MGKTRHVDVVICARCDNPEVKSLAHYNIKIGQPAGEGVVLSDYKQPAYICSQCFNEFVDVENALEKLRYDAMHYWFMSPDINVKSLLRKIVQMHVTIHEQ